MALRWVSYEKLYRFGLTFYAIFIVQLFYSQSNSYMVVLTEIILFVYSQNTYGVFIFGSIISL